MSQATIGTWIQVDALWLYIGGLDKVHTELKGDRLEFHGNLSDWLDDPLLGSREEIESWLQHPHKHGGTSVRLGSQAIGWEMKDERTVVKYHWHQGDVRWGLELEFWGSPKRHPHRRRFAVVSGKAVGRIYTQRVQPRRPLTPVRFETQGELEDNLHRLGVIAREVDKLVRPPQ